MVVEWRHLRAAGNSGAFVWVPDEALERLKPDVLPEYGIEVQNARPRLLGGIRNRVRQEGRLVHDPWRHLRRGQVEADAVPAPLSGRLAQLPTQGTQPRRRRVEPLLRARDQWRAAAVGQRRRGVGGSGAEPRTGYLCMESEGSPVEFRNIRIRELP